MTYLLDSIECIDVYVVATLVQIRISDPGLRPDFEASVTILRPTDPVSRKKGKKKAHKLANNSSLEFKKGKGSTGVELRFHLGPEYKAPSDE